MTPSQQPNPVALETAILSLRRSNQSAVEALVEALKAEEEYAIEMLISETSDYVRNRAGTLYGIRAVRTRIEGAEARVEEFKRREAKNAQYREQRKE